MKSKRGSYQTKYPARKGSVMRALGVAALLLELNTGLLIEGEGSRFMDVMDALYDAIAALNAD